MAAAAKLPVLLMGVDAGWLVDGLLSAVWPRRGCHAVLCCRPGCWWVQEDCSVPLRQVEERTHAIKMRRSSSLPFTSSTVLAQAGPVPAPLPLTLTLPPSLPLPLQVT